MVVEVTGKTSFINKVETNRRMTTLEVVAERKKWRRNK